jgi:hypothetical protein
MGGVVHASLVVSQFEKREQKMEIENVKLECLRIAAQHAKEHGGDFAKVVERAGELSRFVLGGPSSPSREPGEIEQR